MSARRASKGAPAFQGTEYVDYTIEPEELEEAGWVYVGDNSAPGFPSIIPPSSNEVAVIVRDWHDRVHPTAWQWCPEEPCRDVR